MKIKTNSQETVDERLLKKLLSEISSGIDNAETMDVLIELLETKNDPDPSELYLLQSLYQLKEKLKITQSRINEYLIRENKKIIGNKLDDLYNNSNPIGTSILFK